MGRNALYFCQFSRVMRVPTGMVAEDDAGVIDLYAAGSNAICAAAVPALNHASIAATAATPSQRGMQLPRPLPKRLFTGVFAALRSETMQLSSVASDNFVR